MCTAITKWFTLVAIASVEFSVSGGTPGELRKNPTTLLQALNELRVVEATVKSVKKQEADPPDPDYLISTATLEITHVYCGDAIKTGDIFTVVVAGNAASSSMTRSTEIPSPIPQIGETGIWQLYPIYR